VIYIYLLFALTSIVLTSVAQLLVKIGSQKDGFRAYYNRFTIITYIMAPLVFLCSLLALQGLELKLFYALGSLSYAIVVLLSTVVIKESLTRQKIIAVAFIILGTIVFYS
jgi:small multidrug resistance pump